MKGARDVIWHLTRVISWSQTNTTIPLLTCQQGILYMLIITRIVLSTCFDYPLGKPLLLAFLKAWQRRSPLNKYLTADPLAKAKKKADFKTKSLNCHFYSNTSPTSSDPLEKLLPGNDPPQPVPGAPAVMVHSQVDILSLWGHTPKTLAACGLRELPKHNWNTVPQTSHWPPADARSPTHSPTNRKLHIQAKKSLKWSERDSRAEPRGRSANTSLQLCRSCDHREANGREAVGVLPTLLSWIQCLCEGLSTSPCSGGKYKYHWNAYELSKESRSGRKRGVGGLTKIVVLDPPCTRTTLVLLLVTQVPSLLGESESVPF